MFNNWYGMLVKRIFYTSVFFLFSSFSYAQNTESNTELPENDSSQSSQEQNVPAVKKINADLQMVYGQYNNMLSQINFSQQEDNFAYLLTSVFKRSNDYGYKKTTFTNSSYSTDKIGFTGNFNSTSNLKNILDIAIDGGSYGMFDNATFTREEKEKINGSLKNIYKYSPKSEIYLTFAGTYYTHNLLARQDQDVIKTALNRYNCETGGEFIWSASNRVKGKINYTRYDFKKNYQSDDNVQAEIIDDFYITNNFAFSIGLNGAYNRDIGFLGWKDLTYDRYSRKYDVPFFPVTGFSVKGLKNVTFSAEYRYDIQQFRPEEIYFEKKYLLPEYNLKPARIHKTEMKMDIRFGERFNTKINSTLAKSDNFYNYYPAAGSIPGEPNVLVVKGVDTSYATVGVDSNLILKKDVFDMNFLYKYAYYKSEERVSYKPMNTAQINTKYQNSYFIIMWQNAFLGKVYINPNSNDYIKKAIVGTLNLQYKATSNIFANMRIENLYNDKYYLRDGYPESGVSFLFGLRILI